MLSPQGFDEVFEKEASKHPTYRKAFRELNREYREVFGQPRYSNYESYRISRRQRIKG